MFHTISPIDINGNPETYNPAIREIMDSTRTKIAKIFSFSPQIVEDNYENRHINGIFISGDTHIAKNIGEIYRGLLRMRIDDRSEIIRLLNETDPDISVFVVNEAVSGRLKYNLAANYITERIKYITSEGSGDYSIQEMIEIRRKHSREIFIRSNNFPLELI